MLFRIVLSIVLVKYSASQDADCDYYQYVQPGQNYYVYSPNYPNNYRPGVTCRWIAACPTGYNCRIECVEINLPQSTQCNGDRFLVSRSGDPQLTGADKYCGRGTLTTTSLGTSLSLGLITSASNSVNGGRFVCSLSAQIAPPTNNCTCGMKKQNRIVGGTETGINEYPFMLGVVDISTVEIKCGATIISPRYAFSAAHCFDNLKANGTALVAGEHNVEIGDSPATQAYRVERIIIHPEYNPSIYDYDAAILRTTQEIRFSDRVGPVCLPFKFMRNDFTGAKVTILGWGTQSAGGPVSDVLMQTVVDVISQSSCRAMEPTVTSRQMCTLTSGKDACQDDSGGPLLYTDPSTGLMHLVGCISHGRFCASRSPGINTRLTEILQWIVSSTIDAFYCVK